ncbi:AraC family transcriptional regulator [Enterobacter sichuanensis]|uniref:AraC family transcriptional regulator n=1 Tax=Enterobacter sichuanensis TaxID=2071710 RepID=UPI00388E3177
MAYRCGFGDSNHFSTLFRREFSWSPRDIRQGRMLHFSNAKAITVLLPQKANNVRLFTVEVVVWPLS